MQGQTHMLPQQNFANNAAISSWVGMTTGFENTIDGMHDFEDPLNLMNSTGGWGIYSAASSAIADLLYDYKDHKLGFRIGTMLVGG
ncbi:hypothetical protein CC78DRAFT_579418 [Lojkania enalia]|uniref:Uncharacterized protein n=1 Tax=Lojkania enalia TaxID=147567 RepID=A0A9P4KFQ9_9PLEO|nr:hypothetical protein CC78DRAFT_579418 [Didymosphaeria enalia]